MTHTIPKHFDTVTAQTAASAKEVTRKSSCQEYISFCVTQTSGINRLGSRYGPK